MNKNEYINTASKKIINKSVKELVEQELKTHIDEKQAFYEDIDYDSETAESKAVEAMGDVSLVCDEFGEIHNDYYNPIFDIIYLLLWSGLLVGLYFLLKKYVFGDHGAVSLILSAFSFAVSLLIIYEYFTIKRRKSPVIIMSIYAWGGTGAFLYILLDNLNSRFDSNFLNFWKFITNTELSYLSQYVSTKPLLIVLSVIDTLLAIGILIALIYQAKYVRLSQNSIDNKIRRASMKAFRYLSCVFLAFAVFFGAKCYFDIQSLHNEYLDAYNVAIAISESCTTEDEVLKYIDKLDMDFTLNTDADDNITGCKYIHNYTQLIISFNETDTENEYKNEFGSTDINDYIANLAVESLGRDEIHDIYTIELYVKALMNLKILMIR